MYGFQGRGRCGGLKSASAGGIDASCIRFSRCLFAPTASWMQSSPLIRPCHDIRDQEVLPLELWRRILSFAAADSSAHPMIYFDSAARTPHLLLFMKKAPMDTHSSTPTWAAVTGLSVLLRMHENTSERVVFDEEAIECHRLLFSRIVLEKPGHLASLLDRSSRVTPSWFGVRDPSPCVASSLPQPALQLRYPH